MDATVLAAIGDGIGDAGLRPNSCVIKRPTTTRDVGGAVIETFATVDTVSCRIEPAGAATERVVGGRFSSEMDVLVTLDAGTDVDNGDQIECAGFPTFEVIGVPKGSFDAEQPVPCRTST